MPSRSSLGSPASTSRSASSTATATGRLRTARSTRSARTCSFGECRTDGWIVPRSGPTSAPLTDTRGEAELILSTLAFPASPTPSPASGSAMTTPAGGASSSTPSASSASVDPPWSSSKTSQPGLPGDGFDDAVRHYRDWVTESKARSSAVRRTSGRRTGGSGCSFWPTIPKGDSESGQTRPSPSALWPTPNVPNGGRKPKGGMSRTGRTPDGKKRQVGLHNIAETFWATPTSHPRTHDPRKVDHGEQLANQVSLWPTPQVHDGRRPGSDATSTQGTNLKRDAELWHTPRAAADKMGLPRDQARDDLQAQAMLWATPRAEERNQYNSRDNYVALSRQSSLWATPTGRDHKDTPNQTRPDTSKHPTSSYLGLQAPRSGIGGPPSSFGGLGSPQLWSTARSTDWKGERPKPEKAAKKGKRSLALDIHEGPKRRLNPLFVEWLQGFPIGHTDCAPLATPSCPPRPPTPS